MADKTKIDWADASWNPVTGCLHGCEYCYARRMVHRFGGLTPDNDLHVLDEQNYDVRGNKDIYPFGFAPTLHLYRMDFPKRLQRPRNIFVCSMADLFGMDPRSPGSLPRCSAAPLSVPDEESGQIQPVGRRRADYAGRQELLARKYGNGADERHNALGSLPEHL